MSEERVFGPSRAVQRTCGVLRIAGGAGAVAALVSLVWTVGAGAVRVMPLLCLVALFSAGAAAVLIGAVGGRVAYVVHPNYLAVRVGGRDREVFPWDGLLSVVEVGAPPEALRLFRADGEILVRLGDREDASGLRAAIRKEYHAEWHARLARGSSQAFFYPRVFLAALKDGRERTDPKKKYDCCAVGGIQVLEPGLRLVGIGGEVTDIPYDRIRALERGTPLVIRWGDGQVLRVHPELSFFDRFVAALEEERASAAGGPGRAEV